MAIHFNIKDSSIFAVVLDMLNSREWGIERYSHPYIVVRQAIIPHPYR